MDIVSVPRFTSDLDDMCGMNEPRADVQSVLTFPCPRCGDVQRDEFEVMNPNVPTDWRCEACERVFSVLLIDCAICAAETAYVALTAAEHDGCREDTRCPCGARRCCDEESDLERNED